MNLRDLEYLVALAEQRHFGRAAAACYVSQPTLSTQIKKLESHLGAPLIERASRQVLLTPLGEQVVERARAALAAAEDIRGLARRAADPRSGTLRLGLFPTLGPYLLPHVLTGIDRALPGLELLLVEEKSADLLDQLRAGQIDAALLAQPVLDESLHVEPLFREDFVLAVPVGHRLQGAGPVTAQALLDERVLLLTDGHCLRDQALSACGPAGPLTREGFSATSLETLRHMVASGIGVTLLPQLAVRPPVPAHPGLSLVPFAAPAPHRDIALVWRRSSIEVQLLRELAALLADLPEDLVHAHAAPSTPASPPAPVTVGV